MNQRRWGDLSAAFSAAAGSAAVVALALAAANPAYASMTFFAWVTLCFVANALTAGTLGVLWHAFAYRRGWRGLHSYWPPAALAGVALPTLFFLLPALSDPVSQNGMAMLLIGLTCIMGCALGALTAVFYWLMRRPDLDAISRA